MVSNSGLMLNPLSGPTASGLDFINQSSGDAENLTDNSMDRRHRLASANM